MKFDITQISWFWKVIFCRSASQIQKFKFKFDQTIIIQCKYCITQLMHFLTLGNRKNLRTSANIFVLCQKIDVCQFAIFFFVWKAINWNDFESFEALPSIWSSWERFFYFQSLRLHVLVRISYPLKTAEENL